MDNGSSPGITHKVMQTCCLKGQKEEPNHKVAETKKIHGEVVLMKKNVLDVHDMSASLLDRVYELFGKGVSLQLISSVQPHPVHGDRGKHGKAAYLEKWITSKTPLTAKETCFSVFIDWDESIGIPGALVINNYHHSQFFLKTITLKDVPGHGSVHFVCNSWVYPAYRYKYDRIFFSNKTYLPCETPQLLRHYREEELKNLRGNGTGELKEWDRVYDYDYYNDLGKPTKPKYARPVLGGSEKYPYPRRGRTGRKKYKKYPDNETRLPLLDLDIYVPRDERFGHVKFSDFLGYALKSLVQVLIPEFASLTDKTINEFDSFQQVLDLYDDNAKKSKGHTLRKIRECIPWEFLREVLRQEEGFRKLPVPDVIRDDNTAWRTDEEFGREMLAGVNPVIIRRLEVFPPVSTLDAKKYGKQDSTITEELIESNMNGLTVAEAIKQNKLFILDHHDALMPFLTLVNSTDSKIYATRTILLLQDDGTLKPLAIELSLPHPQGYEHGAVSKVFTPEEKGTGETIWQLAKAYAAVNDSGYHQLISHWLNTHAVIEPFIIATNRQLSVLHPIYKLLHPHFKDTMNINALARQTLINAGGILEMTVFPGKYAMEMSAIIYKNWVFTDHALPTDLLKRGIAVEDSSSPHGLKLLIDDYPFAVDGLKVWSAIKTWVTEYCNTYYKTDEMVKEDTELQSWWTEVRTEGHGDKKDEPWWPKMETISELIHSCTIIIWIASALHAAVNFGQYPYAGYLPNRPTVSRRFMPEPGTPEYEEVETNPEVAYLKTITAQFQTLLGVSLIEVLSRHTGDEVYLGQRDTLEWTMDEEALKAFTRFGDSLREIENEIMEMNKNEKWKNRVGPVKVPYTLLYPNTSGHPNEGLTGKGIPNSISI